MFNLFKNALIGSMSLLTFFLLILFSSANVLAEISVDNVTTTYGIAQTFSYNHTINEGTNKVLLVGVTLLDGRSGKSVINVTYNGVNLTYLQDIETAPGIGMWYLVNPPSGEHIVKISLEASQIISSGAISLTGVNQTLPITGLNTSSGTSGLSSVYVASESGDLVVDLIASLSTEIPNASIGQTEHWKVQMGGTSNKYGASSTKPGASFVNMSWNLGESPKDWVMMGFNLNAFIPNSLPTILMNSPGNNSNFPINNILLNLTASDPEGQNMTLWFFGNSFLINTTENILNNSIVIFNWTSLLDGLYLWNAVANDGTDNASSGIYFFTIDMTAPHNNNPADASHVKNSAATIDWILTDSYSSGYYSVQRNGTIQNSSTPWTNNTNLGIWVNTTTIGIWNYTIFYNDSLGNSDFDEVIITIIDNPPYWSSNATNIPVSYSPITESYFNTTWQDDSSISSVWLELNYSGTAMNYSTNHLRSNVYNYSAILAAGTYYWRSWANDSTNQWNSSNTWVFTINNNTGACDVLFNETSPLTYPNVFIVYSNCNSAFTLYRNGTTIGNNSVQALGAGYWNFSVIRTDTSNYTNVQDIEFFTIDKAATYVNLSLNGNENNITINYPETITAIYSTNALTFVMYRNSSDVSSENNTPINLTIGYYNYTVINLGNDNYSGSSKTFFATVNQNANACDVLFNTTSPQTYPSRFKVYGNCDSAFTLYRNGTTITNNSEQAISAGYWNFSVQRTDTQNYTNVYDSKGFTINKATSSCSLSFSPSSPITYGTQVNVSCLCTNLEASAELYRNSTNVTSENNQIVTLGASNYNYLCNVSESENYSSASNSSDYAINQAATSINLIINLTNSNWTSNYPNSTYVINATLNVSDSITTLYRNDTQINQGVTSVQNITTYPATVYYFKANASGNENYSGSESSVYWITINKGSVSLNVASSAGWTLTYPTETSLSGNTCPAQGAEDIICKLWRNNTEITNPTTATYGYGTYNILYNSNDGENWTAATTQNNLTINKNSGACDVLFNETSPKTYPYSFRAYSNCNSNFTLYRNAVPIENDSVQFLAVGSYSFTVIRTDQENYTYVQDTRFFSIEKATSHCNLGFNLESPAIYGEQLNVSCYCSNTEYPLRLWRNGTEITSENNQNVLLTASSYGYICNVSETQNYSSATNSSSFVIEKADSNISLYINGLRSNQNYLNGSYVNFTCDMTNPSSQQIRLWTNYSDGNDNLWNFGNSPIINLSYLEDIGTFWFKCNWSGNENYTSDEETWDVSVFTILPPEVELNYPENNFNSSNQTLVFNCSASDNVNLVNVTLYGSWSGWHANQTNSGPINNTSTIFSKTIPEGNYVWNCYACDNETKCAFAFSNRTLKVDITPPIITLPDYTNATKYRNNQNMTFNISVTDAGVGASYCSVNVDGQTNQTLAVSDEWCNGTYALTGITDGGKTIKVYANDTVGNMALNDSYTVWLDSTAPISDFGTNPPDTYNSTSSDIIFDFRCSDDTGVNKIEVWSNYSGSWDYDYRNTSYLNNTWLNITLSYSNGAYKWAVYCNDHSGNSNFTSMNRTFTVNYAAPSGGGGGGGGGGGSGDESYPNSSDSTNDNLIDAGAENETGNTKTLKESKAGFSVLATNGGTVLFKINESNSSKEVEHVIIIRNATEDRVSMLILSEPIEVTLNIGQSRKVDVDSDDIYDLEITFMGMILDNVHLFIRQIEERGSVCGNSVCETGENEKNCVVDCGQGSILFYSIWGFLGVGGIVIVLAIYLLVTREKQMATLRKRYLKLIN